MSTLPAPDQRTLLIEQRLRAVPYDFAPYSGICYSCRADLIEYFGDRWSTAIVTGCPKCHRSYCD